MGEAIKFLPRISNGFSLRPLREIIFVIIDFLKRRKEKYGK